MDEHDWSCARATRFEVLLGRGRIRASQEATLVPLEKKLAALSKAVQSKSKEVSELDELFVDSSQRTYENSDQYVRRLLVELETGGNIRMEDGRPSDLWYGCVTTPREHMGSPSFRHTSKRVSAVNRSPLMTMKHAALAHRYKSCVDLLHSRFFKEDFAPHGVSGIRVTRVTRIHNRFLRNRFEEHLESMVDISDPTYKRSLEYLVCSQFPHGSAHLSRVSPPHARPPRRGCVASGAAS